MKVFEIGNAEERRWDDYVIPRTGAVTDLYAWRRVVEEAYGIGSHFFACTDDGERIVGTLGLYDIQHVIFGHYLTTAVFGNDGGFHFDNPEARDALLSRAKRLADKLGVQYLVIRDRENALDGFEVDRSYMTAVIDLRDGADALWKRLPAKTRNQARRGMKEGFTVSVGHEQLDAFFDVFHQHMRDLGSPAHSHRYYEKIVEYLGDKASFIVVRDGDALAAGALLFKVNETGMNLHTVSLRKYNPRNPNYLLYWKMMEMSCESELKWFDMGRSRGDSPQLRFKENWKPQEIELTYNFYLRKLKAIPDIDPRNPKYRLQIALWQKMPLAVTKAVGPRLIAGLA
ncbi:MAG TPA: FemAB family XrtA/PEP-CTERM system-associated protein [Gemmatimonadaceae bacterium]|nr:FemAB family XrtA/PEP-CTERM system-associated protein [Gemmatimonadaceae bacterium]